MRHLELDRLWFLRAVLPAQLPTWLFQRVRLHDYGCVRRCQSLRIVHHVVCCIRRCWSIETVPSVVGQQCQRQLRSMSIGGISLECSGSHSPCRQLIDDLQQASRQFISIPNCRLY